MATPWGKKRSRKEHALKMLEIKKRRNWELLHSLLLRYHCSRLYHLRILSLR
jgi:hypothetical protein